MAVKLDLKDKKLLFEIDFDARKTYAELGRKLRMSKGGVEYKLENLEKKKVILGYLPIINIGKFGYYYFRVFVKFQNLTKELKKKVEDYVLSKKEIGWFIWYYGIYDTGFTIWAKTVTEFKEIINEFYFKFHQNIKSRTESIGSEIIFYKNRYLLNRNDTEKILLKEKEVKEFKLDKLDLELLKSLIKNPRSQIIDLSEKLKESPKRVAYRLKRLHKENVLLAIRPNLSHQLFGKTYYKVFIYLNNIGEKAISEFEKYIEKSSKVIYIVKALGTADLDIELMVDSNEDFFNFMEELQSKFPNTIKEYQTMILANTVKAQFLPTIKSE